MNGMTRDELRRQVAEKTYNAFPNYTEDGDRVQWEGVTDAFRAWRCEEADRIIALVTAARDAEIREALLSEDTLNAKFPSMAVEVETKGGQMTAVSIDRHAFLSAALDHIGLYGDGNDFSR